MSELESIHRSMQIDRGYVEKAGHAYLPIAEPLLVLLEMMASDEWVNAMVASVMRDFRSPIGEDPKGDTIKALRLTIEEERARLAAEPALASAEDAARTSAIATVLAGEPATAEAMTPIRDRIACLRTMVDRVTGMEMSNSRNAAAAALIRTTERLVAARAVPAEVRLHVIGDLVRAPGLGTEIRHLPEVQAATREITEAMP